MGVGKSGTGTGTGKWRVKPGLGTRHRFLFPPKFIQDRQITQYFIMHIHSFIDFYHEGKKLIIIVHFS